MIDLTAYGLGMTMEQVERVIAILVAEKDRLQAKAETLIAPGTRVRYWASFPGHYAYGTVASKESPVFGATPVGTHPEPHRVFAHWDGDKSGYASYIYRHQVEIV